MNHQPTIDISIGSVIDRKYRLDTLLNQFGLVKVFRATHLEENTTCAISLRILPLNDENGRKQFLRNAKTLTKPDHPNLLRIIDCAITSENVPYLIYEHSDGISLRELLANQHKLSERQTLIIGRQICAGVNALHELHINHGSLRPESIFIESLSSGDTIVRVSDFGVYRLMGLEHHEPNHEHTEEEDLLGQLKYKAPEHFDGDDQIDQRADLFTICVILYEVLTGVVQSALMSMAQPLRELRPDVSPRLHEIIHSGLSQSTNNRQASVMELMQDLESIEPNFLSDATTQFSTEHKPLSPEEQQKLFGSFRSLIIGQMLSHYQIIEKIGEGGMGEVYLAEDKKLRRKVALKLLPAEITSDIERVRRFELEARTASSLNHPNIITIYEIGESNSIHFIATEFINGKTLRQLIEEHLDLTDKLDIAIQIASALVAAHPAGVVHRDIKPGNIMVRPDGYVKVLDFGLAKFTESYISSSGVHRFDDRSDAGRIMGTPKYMSPEQARGFNVDARTDIFSLGVVLYEMVCGEPPFTGETNSDLLVAVLEREPKPLSERVPDLPKEFERIINRALRKSRESRYQSIQELHSDLKKLKHQLQIETELSRSYPEGMPLIDRSSPTIEVTTPPVDPNPSGTNITAPSGLRWFSSKLMAVFSIVALLTAITIGYFTLWRNNRSSNEQIRSLAILPFRNLKPDSESDFLSFSLADAVITKLSYLQSLTVRPSSAIDKYRNQQLDTKKVAAELRVNTLLVGSFIKDGDDLRIMTQLIDVEHDEIIWRDTLDLKYEKLITVQNRVADEIVKGLELKLTMAETERLKGDIPQNPLAYEYCLRGRDLMTVSANNFRMATEMLEKSVALDPNYALAWAYLGYTYSSNATAQFGGREFYAKAQSAYDRALKLDPEQLDARLFTSLLLTDTGRVEEAIPILRSALQTNPNHARAHWELSYAYRYGGMLKESIEAGERALLLDPEVANRTFNSYFYAGQPERFLGSLPNREDSYFIFYRGLGYYYLKDNQRAAEAFDKAYNLMPGVVFTQIGKAFSHAIKQENERGLELLKTCEQRIEEKGVSDGEVIYKIAQAYALLGDKASALRNLRRSVEMGFFCYPYFTRDVLIESLKTEPEYTQVMELARKRHEDFKKKFF